MLSALATFLILMGLTPIMPTHQVVVSVLAINAVTVLLLLGVIAREVWQVVQARRPGRAGARLHVRIVGLFSVIAAVPAILVAVVASITLDRGLDRLVLHPHPRGDRELADRRRRLSAASTRRSIRGDIMAMSFDVARAKPLFDSDRERFQQFFTAQARVRGLPPR